MFSLLKMILYAKLAIILAKLVTLQVILIVILVMLHYLELNLHLLQFFHVIVLKAIMILMDKKSVLYAMNHVKHVHRWEM